MAEDGQDDTTAVDAAAVDAVTLERFLGPHPTRDADDWYRLWHAHRDFPVRSGRGGWLGRLIRLAKRLLRPLVRLGSAESLERQRIFNLILVETMAEVRNLGRHVADLGRHLEQVHRDHQAAIEAHAGRLEELDVRTADGLRDVMAHNDALFARVDQKLDRYRREARHLDGRLGAVIAAQETAGVGAAAVGEVLREATYVELERRWRGDVAEIAGRARIYLPVLARRAAGPVLDLGCGRGELLTLLAGEGIEARGIDASQAMVDGCRARGLAVTRGDLFDALAAAAAESLGAIVSLHVIEHLAPAALERLVRLAWAALRPGGLLILETPSPLSLVASSRDFWIDPTHVHPVHPAWLEVVYREAGFDLVERLDLHPFPASERLPEAGLEGLDATGKRLAHDVNQLRDRLDDVLFGHRDFALVGTKDAAPAAG